MSRSEQRLSTPELRKRLFEAGSEVVAGDIYVHAKTGGTYHVRLVALRESDAEPMVVYGNAHLTLVWVRPLSEFTDGRFARVD